MIKYREFENIRSRDDDVCVSLYIPTEITGDYEKNRIRWKNACQKAADKLEAKGLDSYKYLKAGIDLVSDSKFWAHQTKGLAGFFSKDYFKIIHTREPKNTIIHVHDHYFLSPLMGDLLMDDRVFILAISQNEVKFFEAVKDGIYPVIIADVVPENMDKALNIDEFNNTLQFRTIGGGRSLFHGTGIDDNSSKELIIDYLRKIDEGLMKFIYDEKVPLVLASVEEYWSIYKDVTKYNYFSDHMIIGNTENLTPQDLRMNVQPVFDEIKNKRISILKDKFEMAKSNDMTSDSFEHIQEMAKYKNIDTLLISDSCQKDLIENRPDEYEQLIMRVIDAKGKLVFTSDENNYIDALLRFKLEDS